MDEQIYLEAQGSVFACVYLSSMLLDESPKLVDKIHYSFQMTKQDLAAAAAAAALVQNKQAMPMNTSILFVLLA